MNQLQRWLLLQRNRPKKMYTGFGGSLFLKPYYNRPASSTLTLSNSDVIWLLLTLGWLILEQLKNKIEDVHK
jgi:hypothetical protein